MNTGPVVVIGPGNVGCGVLGAALQTGARPYVMVARTAESAHRLRHGGVRVRREDSPDHGDLTLRPTATMTIDDPALVEAVAEASVLLVTVGIGQGRALAPWLAVALARRATPVAVLVCDNRDGAAEALRALVLEHDLGAGPRHAFAGVMVDQIVNHTRDADGGTTFMTETPGLMFVDRAALRGAVPDVPGVVRVDRFRSHLTRKRFVFSAGHAAAAYLGGFAGYSGVSDALADRSVASLVEATMREGQAAIAAACGDDFAGGPEDVEQALARFQNRALADTVTRVGRNPLSKLGRNERICGPARLARAGGTSTRALAVTAASALWWGATLDPDLLVRRTQVGPRQLVARLSGLGPRDRFTEDVVAAYRELSELGSPHAALERLGRQVLVDRGRLAP